MSQHQLFNIEAADPSWHACLKQALGKMDPNYLESLYITTDWLPGHHNIFNAFSLPFHHWFDIAHKRKYFPGKRLHRYCLQYWPFWRRCHENW